MHWLTVGCAAGGAYLGDAGAVAAHIDFANPTNAAPDTEARDGKAHALPPGVLVSQADVETALINALQRDRNIAVERNTTLLSFNLLEDAKHVDCTLEVTLQDGSKRQNQLQVSHIIACDGAHSTVRKQMGIPFQGCTVA